MYTIAEIRAEIQRELNMRLEVYPGMIRRGKLTKKKANERYSKLKAALEYLDELEEKMYGVQTTLF